MSTKLLAAGRERIGWAVQELITVMWPLFEGYHQASLAVEEFAGQRVVSALRLAPVKPLKQRPGSTLTAPSDEAPRWQYAMDDIRQQIACLMDPRSFSKTPWDWLRQYPRYFRCRYVGYQHGAVRRR